METLHKMFPNVIFSLNVTDPKSLITPGPKTDWASVTYVLPTLKINETASPPVLTIEGNGTSGKHRLMSYNTMFPGRVVAHFDSQANNPMEPMALFANLTTAQETTIIKEALAGGIQPHARDLGFNLLLPIIGANTYSYSVDEGVIYNGLNTGLDARGTAGSFLQAMQQYFP
jgi:hypothetical protein